MNKPLVVAIIASDEREVVRDYSSNNLSFGPSLDALLHGFAELPDCHIHVISCLQHPVSSPSNIAPNISFHALIVPRRGWLRSGYAGCISAIRRKLRELKPDLVHGQGTERYCALAAAFSGLPNVITIQGNMRRLASLEKAKPFSFLWLHARLESFVLPRTGGVLCNSSHTESLVKASAKRVWRVPHALDRRYFSPMVHAPRKTPRLLNIGTISQLKQQLELLESLQTLHAKGADFEIEFLGRADSRSAYGSRFLSQINGPSVQRFARYGGFETVQNLVQRLDSASALVHVSQEESFGLVVAEALARNLKVFAFKAGAVPEIATGVDGAELIDRNDWEGLRGKIGAWLNTGAPLPTHAAALMRERYSPKAIARQHLEIYREMLVR